MGAQPELLVVLATLLCCHCPVRAAESCNRLQHLENGWTFSKYGGLLVLFRCHLGYKLHGYDTNSCISGRWSREKPVCVAPGCLSPGSLQHGTSSVDEDGSWVRFSCNDGYRLHGPSMLYCKGQRWNSTKPVCKEFDIMSSAAHANTKNSRHRVLPGPSEIKRMPQQFGYGTTKSKEVLREFGASRNQSQPEHDQGTKGTFPTVHPEQHVRYHDTEDKQSSNSPSSSPPSLIPTSTHHFSTTSAPAVVNSSSVLEFGVLDGVRVPVPTHHDETPTGRIAGSPSLDLDHHKRPLWPMKEGDSKKNTVLDPSIESLASSTKSSPVTPVPSIPLPTTTAASLTYPTHPNSENQSRWTQYKTITDEATITPRTQPLTPSRRPICSHPPVPAHGTLSFRRVPNPGPRDSRHFVEYACHSGYTLAHGDAHRYCQQGGKWSGVTPMCLDINECLREKWRCVNLPGAHHCNCPRGYTFHLYGKHCNCQYINGCGRKNGGCSLLCVTHRGGPRCACPASHRLPLYSWKKCVLRTAVGTIG